MVEIRFVYFFHAFKISAECVRYASCNAVHYVKSHSCGSHILSFKSAKEEKRKKNENFNQQKQEIIQIKHRMYHSRADLTQDKLKGVGV